MALMSTQQEHAAQERHRPPGTTTTRRAHPAGNADLDQISLGEAAAAAKIPKGSAYHFYDDIKHLYASLLDSMEQELPRR